MRNILDQSPNRELRGAQAYAARLAAADLAGRDVLDVGCGFGWFELFALKYGPANIVGVDVSDADLATARKHVEGATFLVGSATELPVADESADVVVCWEVLEHLPVGSEPQAFAEFRRVLRPGGMLYLSTPYASRRARALDPAWWMIGHRHYRLRELDRFSRDAGLEPELLEVRGGAWQLLLILDLYVSKWLLRRPPLFEAAVNRRYDAEFERPGGYANCFLKAQRRP